MGGDESESGDVKVIKNWGKKIMKVSRVRSSGGRITGGEKCFVVVQQTISNTISFREHQIVHVLNRIDPIMPSMNNGSEMKVS